MCIAVPAEVLEVYDDHALVHFKGVKTTVNRTLIEYLKPGDYVLIHTGCALQILDLEEAYATLELINKMVEGIDNEDI